MLSVARVVSLSALIFALLLSSQTAKAQRTQRIFSLDANRTRQAAPLQSIGDFDPRARSLLLRSGVMNVLANVDASYVPRNDLRIGGIAVMVASALTGVLMLFAPLFDPSFNPAMSSGVGAGVLAIGGFAGWMMWRMPA